MSTDVAGQSNSARATADFDGWLASAKEADPYLEGAIEDAACRAALLRQLAACRSELGLSQAAVAGRMETSQSAVSELEGGLTDPRLSTLQRYARSVDCSIRIHLQSARTFAPLDEFPSFGVSHVGVLTGEPSQFKEIPDATPLTQYVMQATGQSPAAA